jgi:hypothetical protein
MYEKLEKFCAAFEWARMGDPKSIENGPMIASSALWQDALASCMIMGVQIGFVYVTTRLLIRAFPGLQKWKQ